MKLILNAKSSLEYVVYYKKNMYEMLFIPGEILESNKRRIEHTPIAQL